VWRDAICNWFHKTSGIADLKNRVGQYPDRVEAEAMQLTGYEPVDVTPWENASRGKGVECRLPKGCAAEFKFDKAAGWYTVDVQYFDQNNGASRYRVLVNDRMVDEWIADNDLPAQKAGGDSSSRRRIRGITLRPGNTIRIEGIPDGEERAGLDFLSIFN